MNIEIETEISQVKTKGAVWTMFFIYTPKGNYLIKGWVRSDGWDIEQYVNKKFEKCFYRYTFWQNGQSRGGWRFANKERNRHLFWMSGRNLLIDGHTVYDLNNKLIKISKNKTYAVCFHLDKIYAIGFRKVPTKWIAEFDQL